MASVLMLFESGDLFIRAGLLHLETIGEAERILAANPTISAQDGWLYMDYLGGVAMLYDSDDTADECGKWLPNTDRTCLEDFLDSTLSLPDFMELNPRLSEFRLVWFAVQDEHGTRSEYTGKAA